MSRKVGHYAVFLYFEILCATSAFLCVSAVNISKALFTTETPRTQRLRREKLKLVTTHYAAPGTA